MIENVQRSVYFYVIRYCNEVNHIINDHKGQNDDKGIFIGQRMFISDCQEEKKHFLNMLSMCSIILIEQWIESKFQETSSLKCGKVVKYQESKRNIVLKSNIYTYTINVRLLWIGGVANILGYFYLIVVKVVEKWILFCYLFSLSSKVLYLILLYLLFLFLLLLLC